MLQLEGGKEEKALRRLELPPRRMEQVKSKSFKLMILVRTINKLRLANCFVNDGAALDSVIVSLVIIFQIIKRILLHYIFFHADTWRVVNISDRCHLWPHYSADNLHCV